MADIALSDRHAPAQNRLAPIRIGQLQLFEHNLAAAKPADGNISRPLRPIVQKPAEIGLAEEAMRDRHDKLITALKPRVGGR